MELHMETALPNKFSTFLSGAVAPVSHSPVKSATQQPHFHPKRKHSWELASAVTRIWKRESAFRNKIKRFQRLTPI